MKKILVILLAFVMLFCLCACSGSENQNTDSGNSDQMMAGDTDSSKEDTDLPEDDADTPEDNEDSSEDDEEVPDDSSDGCKHKWEKATCTAPTTCTVCGKTVGAAKGHSWQDATCAAPKTCARCGATEGTTLSHSWSKATCATPKTCTVCGATEGKALGHSWSKGSCTTPKTCATCGETDGAAPGHSWKYNSGASTKTCTKCGVTESDAPDAGVFVIHANYDEKAASNAAKIALRNGLGMTWDDQYAYLVYSGKKPSVSVDGKNISFTKVSNTVMKVKLSTLGIDPDGKDKTISAKIGSWSGYVVFERLDVQKGNEVDQFMPLSDAYYDASVAQRLAAVKGNTYTFSGVEQSMGFQNVDALDFTGVNIVEFDFKPTSMTQWPNFGGLQGSSGAILFFITNGANNKVGFAISQDAKDGQNPNDFILTSMPGTSGHYSTYDYVNLTDVAGLTMNGTIHLRVEVHNQTGKAPTVKYYVDGELLLVDEEVAFDTDMSSSIPGYTKGFSVMVGKHPGGVVLSNVTFGKEPVPVAVPTGSAPADGDLVMYAKYDKKASSNAAKIRLDNGLGMTWDDQYAYLVYSGTGKNPAVFVGGKRISFTQVSQKTNTVLKVELKTLGVEAGKGKTITAAIGDWSGYIIFEKLDVTNANKVYHYMPLNNAYYDPNVEQRQATVKDNTYTFAGVEQSMGFGGNNGSIAALKSGGTSVVEFDFSATSLYQYINFNGVQNSVPPIFMIRDDLENVFTFSIGYMQTGVEGYTAKHVYLVVEPKGGAISNSVSVDLTDAVGFVPGQGKTMHIRLEIDHKSGKTACVRYYVNGKLVLTNEHTGYHLSENVHQAQGMVILQGKYKNDFVVSNLSFAKK